MKDKIAIVTAAGQGIGRATAERLAREGARVYALDNNPDALADVRGMEPVVLDCASEDALGGFLANFDRLDVLVHGVGWVHHGTIEDCTPADWRKCMALTLDSAYIALRLGVMRMKQNGGSIVAIASIASSIKGFPNRAAYGAAKGGVIGLVKAVAADYLAHGIRCNAVCPGTTQSPSLDERIATLAAEQGISAQKARQMFIDRQPMGRLGTPEEIAGMCHYLASDESHFVTGQCFHIDGGTTI